MYVDVIGDVLDEFAGSMEVYRTYCVNEAQAGRLLQALRGQLPELAAHLQVSILQSTYIAVSDLEARQSLTPIRPFARPIPNAAD